MAIKTQNFVHIHIVTCLHCEFLSKTLSVIATFWKQTALGAYQAKRRGIVVNVERRHICNQIVRIPEDTDYATVPRLLTRNDDLWKLWMKKSPQ